MLDKDGLCKIVKVMKNKNSISYSSCHLEGLLQWELIPSCMKCKYNFYDSRDKSYGCMSSRVIRIVK